jgi:RNA polymerase sigma-70 factor, ECF subfamily
MQGRAGAAPTTTGRASIARWPGSGKQDGKVYECRKPVVEPPQATDTGSNLADRGRAAARGRPCPGWPTPRLTGNFESVLAYALRRTEPEEAEDVVAETFAIAWRRLDAVPPDALPWLFGVARRVLSNQRRSIFRRQALASRVTREFRGLRPESRDPADVVSEREHMQRALGTLSHGDREVLMLVAWDSVGRSVAHLSMLREGRGTCSRTRRDATDRQPRPFGDGRSDA